jgi:hypothetical protein
MRFYGRPPTESRKNAIMQSYDDRIDGWPTALHLKENRCCSCVQLAVETT